jgi:hypothetical protein
MPPKDNTRRGDGESRISLTRLPLLLAKSMLVMAVTAPPGPEPMTATSHLIASAIASRLRFTDLWVRIQNQYDETV